MNRAFSPLLKSLLAAIVLVSSFAHASEEKQAAKADPAKGEALYTNGDNARGITACFSCHGAAGNSVDTKIPKLASQHEAYVYKQLKEFKSAERKNPIMGPIAGAMTEDEMKNVAAFLNAQVAKQGAAKTLASKDLGKKIYRAGIAEKSVPACAGCHSPNGAGIPAQFPRIAGQHQDYTIAQLTNFHAGDRKNSPQMATIGKRMSNEEINAVADYVAGLK